VRRRTKTLDRDWSLPPKQRRRLIRAAQYWLTEYPQFRGLDIAFEVVLTAPLAWPRYITYTKLRPRSELHGR
jgi:putative endonuclease